MPTLTELPGGCAFPGLATWSALPVASIADESEVATGEPEAPVSALTFSAYVIVYGCTVVSNHKPT